MKIRSILPSILMISLILISCTKDDSNDDSNDSDNQTEDTQFSGSCSLRTVGGATCSDGPGPIAYVTGVLSGSYTSICTGSFIANNKVLTAAHCLQEPGTLTVVSNGVQLPVLKAEVHPQYDNNGGYDAMVLTVPPQSNVSPLPLLLSEAVSVGDAIAVYGYGPEPGSSFGPNEVPPLGRAELNIAQISQEDLFLTATRQSGGSGGCAGDSGGPAIRSNRNGSFGIVAIVLGGNNNTCEAGTRNDYTGIQANSTASFILSASPSTGSI